MHSGEAWFLLGLEGTDITTDKTADAIASPSSTWTITQKLSERAFFLTQDDVSEGHGSPFTAGRFLCHHKEDATKIAFLRIYQQITAIGTEFAKPSVRAQQATPADPYPELEALRALNQLGCDVVPSLLGYHEGKQGPYDIVPGGHITYLVWDKVPGESLTKEKFWNLDRRSRNAVRAEFRSAHEQVLHCGFEPRLATPSKIIYDEVTGKIHISGFRRACSVDDQSWSDTYVVMHGLAKPCDGTGWNLHTDRWEW